MSKIGKKNILIPKESSIKIDGSILTIVGPKGSKHLTVNDKIFSAKLNENELQIFPLTKKIDKKTSIMWGTYRSLINNAVTGVSEGHEKTLELNGVGFRANLKGEVLNPSLINYSEHKGIKKIVLTGKIRRIYSKEMKSNLDLNKGEIFYENGDYYEGEIDFDLPFGKGRMTFKDGTKKSCEWFNGNPIENKN